MATEAVRGIMSSMAAARQPQQNRSIESTNRMLDAAEELIAEGGPDALTIEAVVTRAGTSIGSFYARFGDRRGLLVAVQDRFLGRIAEMAFQHAGEVEELSDLDTALTRFVELFLDIFRVNRNAFNVILVQTRGLPEFEKRGAEVTKAAAKLLHNLLVKHKKEIAHRDLDTASEMVFRTLFALATQIVMMNEGEITGHQLSERQWVDETSRMLLHYLTSRPTET